MRFRTRAGHRPNSEWIWNGYPANFFELGVNLDFKSFLKTGFGEEPDLNIYRKKILVNELLLYSSKIFVKQHTISL